jgi:hypothetical protein
VGARTLTVLWTLPSPYHRREIIHNSASASTPFARRMDSSGCRDRRRVYPRAEPQTPIVGQDIWEQVQQSLRAHLGAERTKRTRQAWPDQWRALGLEAPTPTSPPARP